MLRTALLLSAGLILASAAQAAECPHLASLRQHPYLATITVSGPLLSAMPCGHTDCATFAVAGITGRKVSDPRIASAFATPTTTYYRWTGTQGFAGDGVQWHAAAALPRPPDSESAATGATTQCRSLGDTALNGRAMEVFSTHSEANGHVLDVTTWIGKADRLPAKAVMRFAGGRVTVVTFDYASP